MEASTLQESKFCKDCKTYSVEKRRKKEEQCVKKNKFTARKSTCKEWLKNEKTEAPIESKKHITSHKKPQKRMRKVKGGGKW